MGEDDELFVKSLESDVSNEETQNLLNEVISNTDTDLWDAFTDEDVRLMGEVFSVLKMAPGDKIITKDEYATFCGIILSGTFNAIVSPTLTVPLGPGAMVGEMALFEGGTRNADIVTGEDDNNVLAVITFLELDGLSMSNKYSQLERKLTHMFAAASIKKLRNMSKPKDPAPAPAADNTSTAAPSSLSITVSTVAGSPTSANTATPAPVVPPTPNTAATAASIAPIPAPKLSAAEIRARREEKAKAKEKPVQQESLYKTRQERARAMNRTEVEKAAEEEKQKRLRAEAARRNANVQIQSLERKLKEQEEVVRGAEESVRNMQAELNKALETRDKLQVQNFSLTRTVDELTKSASDAQRAKSDAEKRGGELSESLEQQIASLKAQLDQSNAQKTEMESSILIERQASSVKLASREEDLNKLTKSHMDLLEEKDKISKEYMEQKERLSSLESELERYNKVVEDNKVHSQSLALRLQDAEEKLSVSLQWKMKALEFQSALESEKKRHARSNEEMGKKAHDAQEDLLHYKKILKFFSIAIFMKEYRIRRQMVSLHRKVSEMLMNTLEEHYQNSNNPSNPHGSSSISSATHSSSLGGMSGLSSGSTSLSLGLANSARGKDKAQTFKSIRKRKRVYLDSLMRTNIKLRDILSSLDDEVSKLKAPFEEVQERVRHWRATSESFFQRNIDLASKLMTLEKSYNDIIQQKESLTHSLKLHHRDLERLQQRHADLNAKVHGMKESDREKILSGSSALGSSGVAPSPTSPSNALNSSVNNGATNLGQKQELELLEARATVLRVHVSQLEQHYMQLMQAIHSANAAQQQQQFIQQQHFPGQDVQDEEKNSNAAYGAPAYRYDPSLVSPVPMPNYYNNNTNIPNNTNVPPHPNSSPRRAATSHQPRTTKDFSAYDVNPNPNSTNPNTGASPRIQKNGNDAVSLKALQSSRQANQAAYQQQKQGFLPHVKDATQTNAAGYPGYPTQPVYAGAAPPHTRPYYYGYAPYPPAAAPMTQSHPLSPAPMAYPANYNQPHHGHPLPPPATPSTITIVPPRRPVQTTLSFVPANANPNTTNSNNNTDPSQAQASGSAAVDVL